MDDNRTQATSAHQSGYKHESGCDIKRDSSFLDFGISPSKVLISNVAVTGFGFLPGAAAPHKKNRPVNMRAGKKSVMPGSVSQRAATGHKKSRGGEKKGSSCQGHISPPINYTPLLTVNMEVFLASFPQHRPTFFKGEFKLPKKFAQFCFAEADIG